jgi:hypothetical protein
LKTVAYTLFQDLGLANFVLVRFIDLKLYLAWMGRAENEVIKDEHSKILDIFVFNGGCLIKRNK